MNLWNYMLYFSWFLFLLGTLSPRRGEEECCSPGSCWWWSHWGTTSPETPSTGLYTFLRGGPGNQSSYLSDSPPNSPPPPPPTTHPPTHPPTQNIRYAGKVQGYKGVHSNFVCFQRCIFKIFSKLYFIMLENCAKYKSRY